MVFGKHCKYECNRKARGTSPSTWITAPQAPYVGCDGVSGDKRFIFSPAWNLHTCMMKSLSCLACLLEAVRLSVWQKFSANLGGQSLWQNAAFLNLCHFPMLWRQTEIHMYTRAPIVTWFLHVSSNCGPALQKMQFFPVCKGMLERGIRLVKWLSSQTKRSRQRDRRSSKPESRFYFMNKR